uniref:Uncharacterized protein n=1 Tax=virus sp. ctDJ83 TaxID=2827625 RepID=A0A8S5RJU9_9VIRU|nr:MAG TPA: hypothetical protein [virus sp. ctDJ83]
MGQRNPYNQRVKSQSVGHLLGQQMGQFQPPKSRRKRRRDQPQKCVKLSTSFTCR